MADKLPRRDFLKGLSATATAGTLAGTAMATEGPGASEDSPRDVIREPPRETAVVHECDICVIGGSCTGVFAAVAAARLGAAMIAALSASTISAQSMIIGAESARSEPLRRIVMACTLPALPGFSPVTMLR